MLRIPHDTQGTIPPALLKECYRREVMLHHPDHNAGDRLAKQRFQEISEAYNALQHYDEGIVQRRQSLGHKSPSYWLSRIDDPEFRRKVSFYRLRVTYVTLGLMSCGWLSHWLPMLGG
jgi:hypothetical protein